MRPPRAIDRAPRSASLATRGWCLPLHDCHTAITHARPHRPTLLPPQAKKNVALNGAAVQRSARVAYLDWSEPPPRTSGAVADAAQPASDVADADDEVAAELGGQFELLIAADIINNQGLSELVYRCCSARRLGVTAWRATAHPRASVARSPSPRAPCAPQHDLALSRTARPLLDDLPSPLPPPHCRRHPRAAPRVGRLRDAHRPSARCRPAHTPLVRSVSRATAPRDGAPSPAQVPPWLAQGIEEAQVIKHELYVVQWRDPARARAEQGLS